MKTKSNKNKGPMLAALVLAALPSIALAQTTLNFKSLITLIIEYLQSVLLLLMALSLVIFVWYIIQYFIKSSETPEKRKQAGAYLMYSILGFFIIFSFWGIVSILQNTFGLGNVENSPGSWGSFLNIFPGQHGSSGTNGNAPAGTVYDPFNDQSTHF